MELDISRKQAREALDELERYIAKLEILAIQYRNDMRYTPTPDSRLRRIKAINDVIGDDGVKTDWAGWK